jgi:hypothetical protein
MPCAVKEAAAMAPEDQQAIMRAGAAGTVHFLVRTLELGVFTLELLELLALFRCQGGSSTRVTLGLTHPVAQRLRRAADLRRNRPNRGPLRIVLSLALEHHLHRPLLDLW